MASVRHGVAGVLATLLATVMSVASASLALEVEAFDVEQVGQLRIGARLNFSLYGTPGAVATLRIDGAARELVLQEVQPGAYEGSYVLDAQDRIRPDGTVTATLRRGDQMALAVLEEPLMLGTVPAQAAVRQPADKSPPIYAQRRAAPPATADECRDCAVVESVHPIASDTFIGRENRDFARVVGVIGGMLGTRALERITRMPHEVVLRLPNGTRVIRTYDQAPPFRAGDTVRLGVNLGGARAERLATPLPPYSAR